MVKTTVIDNFFDDPYSIRNYALSLKYPNKGIYPGKRTLHLKQVNENFYNEMVRKIMSSVFQDYSKIEFDMDLKFQLGQGRYKEGWAHADGKYADMSGIVYLSPDAPLNSGTIMCDPVNPEDWNRQEHILKTIPIRNKLYLDEIDNADDKRIEHNSQFVTNIEVSNIFNRAFIFNSHKFHRENVVFEDRLIMIFSTKLFFKV
jgi:hypothetical protein